VKIAFLTVMPSPYVQDVFHALSQDRRCELSVYYLEQESDNTLWGEQPLPDYAQVLPGSWFYFGGGRIHYNTSVIHNLKKADADVYVVVGYPGLTNQTAMYWLACTRRPWIFWGEIPGMRSLGLVASGLRRVAQFPLRSAKAIAAVGSQAVAAYRELLGSSVPVFNVPYHCATDEFTRAAEARNHMCRTEIRFLYCGQLIERKGVDILLNAFLKLRDRYPCVRLDLVGTGPLEEELRNRIPFDVLDAVTFHGFRPVADLPRIFATADVFVLPSRHDGWGVVVNQAVASRLPVITTTAVGAAHDLVTDGESGFVVAPDSSEALYTAMEPFAIDSEKARACGERSFEFTSRINVNRAVEDWIGVSTSILGSVHRNRRTTESVPTA
jgi:glycosyltransferase involved in cell wall biosynthesis